MRCGGKRIIALGILALLISSAVFVYSIATSPRRHDLLTVWTSTENGVEVTIDLKRHPSGQFMLSGTFTPTQQGFHLYSKDLPKDGLQGLGRPTLLEVVKSNTVKATGPLEANQPIQNIYFETLDISFPVYPAGPVTLGIPLELVGNGSSLEISITYMACSDKTCLPPVIDKHVFIEVPMSSLDD